MLLTETCAQKTSKSSPYPRRLHTPLAFSMAWDLPSLRNSAAAILSRDDVEDVKWAGVFGSFAVGKQTDLSDVDVVVIQEHWDHHVHLQPKTFYLEDILPRIWGRKVDLVRIIRGEDLRGYVAIESLLSAHTLYGPDQDSSFVQLRKDAEAIFDAGVDHFEGLLDDIRKARAMATRIPRQKFNTCSLTRNVVRDGINSIFNALNIQPMWHPMRDAFWYLVIEPVQDIQAEMRSLRAANVSEDDNTEYWDLVWEVATSTKLKSLDGLGRRIIKLVFTTFDLTREKRDLATALQKRDETGAGLGKKPENGPGLANGQKHGGGVGTEHRVENP